MSHVASRKHFRSVLYVIMVLVSLPIIFAMVDCEMCDNLLFP